MNGLNRFKKSLALVACALILPLAAFAKTPDSTYGYVSSVFEKLQAHWEEQVYANQLTDNTLTFVVNEDGTLHSSGLDVGADTDSGRAMLAYLNKNAPFGAFPAGLEGRQVQFNFKLSPGSMRMVSYQLMPTSSKDSVLAFATPVSNQPQPVSLFYTRVGAPGRVWENTAKPGNSEETMTNYVEQVRQQVKNNWKLPQDYVFQRTIAVLMIDRDGTLLSASLKQSSGDATVDKAALNAIITAGKFPEAPANVPSLPVTIDYVFEPVLSSAEL
ncbi:energy transducer TonB [Vampirovibrio sp.]|uniref:energy transducer TonB n=1 Tax=Vampirovibrio sp. TaxID=2717857 RepID=UPI003593AD8B